MINRVHIFPENLRMGSGLNRRQTDQAEKPTHASADAVQQPASENPLTAPIYEFIQEADAHQLQYARKTLIPHCKGILETERAALHEAVDSAFARLNASDMKPFSQGRKSLLSQKETNRQNDKPN